MTGSIPVFGTHLKMKSYLPRRGKDANAIPGEEKGYQVFFVNIIFFKEI